jgi:glycosyltransferase involved in cell wall biosynthesis
MIEYFPIIPIKSPSYPPDHNRELFSILIPSWNNLEYLKLCVHSIRKNSKYKHQIVIHVNDGSDGTLQWVKEQGFDYTHSRENVGICWALNAGAAIATTDYILYINDDMYACPDWDDVLYQEVVKIGHDRFFLSSTMIEPRETGNPAVISCADFGDSIETFKENELLKRVVEFKKDDWSGGTGAPNLISKRLWHLVGGYSVEFSPGMASDPEFSMKLWQLGIRYFKGLGQSRAFHFQCKSTGRVVRNDGGRQFLRKWRIGWKTFAKWYLRFGAPFEGPLKEGNPPLANRLRDSIRCHW